MSGRAQKVLGEALDLTDEERAEVALELVATSMGRGTPTRRRLGSPRSNVAHGACCPILTAARTGRRLVPRSNRSSGGREAGPG